MSKRPKLADAMRGSVPEQPIKTTSDLVSRPAAPTDKPKKTVIRKRVTPSVTDRSDKTGMLAYVDAETHREVAILLLDLRTAGIKLTRDELLREGLSMVVAKYQRKLSS